MTLLPGHIRPERPEGRPLTELVQACGLTALGGVRGIRASGLAVRTQDVRPGDVFAGLPGASAHGAAYAAEAARRGAVALLTDDAGAGIAAGVGLPVLVAPQPRAVLGEVAAWIHRSRERAPLLLGVTGTNGKTTTVHLIEELLERLGIPTGISSTAERGTAGERVPSRLTTPEASELHALLARLTERGVRAAAIEVSAQALVRSRVDGLLFDVAGFTNLTHEHLDDFGTMSGYLAAKARLFEVGASRRGVVVVDSPAGAHLAQAAPIPVTTVAAAPGVAADWRVSDIRALPGRTRFSLTGPRGEHLTTQVHMLGAHQAVNAALAVVMVIAAGHPFDRVARALGPDGLHTRVPGRLERLPHAVDPAVYLDIAHTPDALTKSLEALRTVTTGRLVAVFGADGDRDRSKRAPMGRAAAQLADVVVIHDHHSRHEDPAGIRAMLLSGARGGSAAVHEVPDPSEAIRVALAAAGPDGAVLWAGTGRTEYRDVAGQKVPYSFWHEAQQAASEWASAVRAVRAAESVHEDELAARPALGAPIG